MGDSTVYGEERSFTTLTPPAVTTNAASNLTINSARLNGNLTSLGTADSVTVSFQWGTSSGSYPNETTAEVKDSTGTFYFDLGSLTHSTTYYYRAKAVGDSTVYGAERSFTTLTPPAVTTNRCQQCHHQLCPSERQSDLSGHGRQRDGVLPVGH